MNSLKTRLVLSLVMFMTVASSFSSEVLATWNYSSFVTSADVAVNDGFGSVVDVSGDWAVVGAPVKGARAGAAYVLHKDSVTGQFVEYKKLVVADKLVANDNFGFSVAINGDDIAVGAYGRTSSIGAVYLFSRNQGGDENWGMVKRITVAGGVKADYFGRAVDLDGDNLAVSAFGANGMKGAGYVFSRNQGGENNWGLVKKMVASDGIAGDYLGDSIAISGENVVMGTYRDNSTVGSVYLYSKNQGGENNYGEVKRLAASDGVASANFGYAVDIDGDNVVVGAYRMNSKRGAVYIFSKDQGGSGNFGQVKKLIAKDTLSNDSFGYSLKLDGSKLVVGAVGKLTFGASYLFDKDLGGANNWGQVLRLPADGLMATDYFGYDVAVNGGTILSGISGSDRVVSNGGGVYVYRYNNPPVVDSIVGSQSIEDKRIKIAYQLSDLDSDVPTVDGFEYSLNEGVDWIKMEGEGFSDDKVGTVSYDFCALNGNSVQGVLIRSRAKDAIDLGDWKVAGDKVVIDCRAPVVANLAASQLVGSDDVNFSYDLADDSDVVLVELGVSADSGENWDVVATNVTGDLGANIVTGVGKKILWKAGVDLADNDKSTMMFRVRATDKFGNVSDYVSSSVFSLDTKAPAINGVATLTSEPSVNVTLNWEPTVDSNFGFYDIWYGQNADEVKGHSGTSKLWNKDNDLALSTLGAKKTTITGLDYSTVYYFEIWAFDSFGHKSLISEVSTTTPEKPVTVTVTTNTIYQERQIYVYQQTDTAVNVDSTGTSSVELKPTTLEVPQSVQVVDGVFRVPEDLQAVSTQVFEIKDALNNLSLYIPSDAEITLGGKEKFYGDIFKPVIQSGAPLVSQDISNDILLTINAETSANESVYFSKPVIVTFDLEKALNGASLDSKNLIVYFYDKTKEKYDYVSDLAISLDGKTAAFLTYHFSTFVVMEDSVAASPLVNNEIPFDDVSGHWSETYVNQLFADGVVKGKGYRKFLPSDTITRAEFLKMVLMAFGYDINSNHPDLLYSDVSKDHWAYDFVGLADGLGLVEGYGAGSFKPDAEISRAEALKILVTASGQSDDLDKYKGVSKFLDVQDSGWYLPYLNYSVSNEVVGGYGNGLFGPDNSLTRAEAAKMVVKMLQLKNA